MFIFVSHHKIGFWSYFSILSLLTLTLSLSLWFCLWGVCVLFHLLIMLPQAHLVHPRCYIISPAQSRPYILLFPKAVQITALTSLYFLFGTNPTHPRQKFVAFRLHVLRTRVFFTEARNGTERRPTTNTPDVDQRWRDRTASLQPIWAVVCRK